MFICFMLYMLHSKNFKHNLTISFMKLVCAPALPDSLNHLQSCHTIVCTNDYTMTDKLQLNVGMVAPLCY